jgi:SAM-dependent methyltransferase
MGAPHTAATVHAHSGCEVWQQDFLKLDLPRGRFDGVVANAAVFHVPSQELPRVLRELHASLKPGGGWRAVQFEPALPQRGRLGPRALLRVSQS